MLATSCKYNCRYFVGLTKGHLFYTTNGASVTDGSLIARKAGSQRIAHMHAITKLNVQALQLTR
jgi:hypothetical protein